MLNSNDETIHTKNVLIDDMQLYVCTRVDDSTAIQSTKK